MPKGTAHQHHKAAIGIAPAVYTATVNGAAIDAKGFDEALIVVHAGTFTSTAAMTVKVQESADGSTGWADVTGAAFASIAVANDATIYVGGLALRGTKRYLRLVGTYANTGNAILSAEVILTEALIRPVTQVNTAVFNVRD